MRQSQTAIPVKYRKMAWLSILSSVFLFISFSVGAETTILQYTIRDFLESHDDFQQEKLALDSEIVSSTLGGDRKPVYSGGTATPPTTSGALNFNQWFNDVISVNERVTDSFTLDNTITVDPNVFTFSEFKFFPIDNRLFGNETRNHNFHFTTELHTKFNYRGGEILTFTSDDDLWVFINNTRVVDIGGIHTEETRVIDLDALAASLGISVGNQYEFDLFFAERQTVGSVLRFDMPSPASPISVGQDINISEVAAADKIDPAAEVIMEVNPVDPKHLVVMANGGLLYYSLDGGMDWHQADVTFPLTGGFLTDPSLTFDDQGTLFAAIGIEESVQKIAICRFENGAFVSKPVPYSCTINPGKATQKWHIGAGPAPGNSTNQNVYVALQGPGSDEIGVTYSVDGGKTFTASNKILGRGHFPRPVVATNGDVYVAWFRENGEVVVARSTNGGQDFAAPVLAADPIFLRFNIVPAQPKRGIFTGPVIDVDRSGGLYDGSLYITYVDEGSGGGDDYDIFVVRSQDQGRNWSTPVRVNNDTDVATQFLPWLDVDRKTGTISVIWYDARNDSANVKVKTYLSTSVDGGRTFGPNIPIADAESDESDHGNYKTSRFDYAEYIGVAVDNCVAHAVWSDNHMTHANAKGFFRTTPPCSMVKLLRLME